MNTLMYKSRSLPLLVAFSMLLGIIQSNSVFAVIEQVAFENAELEARYKDIIDELRCLVCQNQNLAGSDAPLAKDLRKKTEQMLKAGKSDTEIKQFMRDRYGDFVLYKPPFTTATAFLWVGPFIALLIIIVVLLRRIQRKQDSELLRPSQSEDEATRVKVRNLMKNAPDLSDSSSNEETNQES